MTPTVHLIEIYAYDICTSETITRPLPISADPKKFWRQYHRTYDQTHYVAKEVRHALSIERPKTRKSVIAWLFREKERQLIAQAYRVQGTRGLLIKTLCQPGARVLSSSTSQLTRSSLRGMPIEQIQKFLGHAKLETIQIYAESSAEMIKESYQPALAG
jgi:hypothetical protein